MSDPHFSPLKHPGVLAGSLLLLCLAPGLVAAQEQAQLPIASVPSVLDLPTARKLALERQPAVAAARESLAVAQAKVKALHNLGRLADFLRRRDLPIRQHQAELGLQAAEARLHQVEVDTLYAVNRCYWTVVYAQSQLETVDEALSENKEKFNLNSLKVEMEELRYPTREDKPNDADKKDIPRKKDKRPDIDKEAINQIDILIAVMKGRREDALQGVQRGLAALREAIGLEPDCHLVLADQELPWIANPPCLGEIVALALARRGEITQTAIAAEVCELEIKAQELSCALKVETFAAGSDIHAVSLPTAYFGADYRPGPEGLQMPINLVGPKCLRAEQAQILYARALAAVDKMRGLLRLEAENAWLLWKDSDAKAGLHWTEPDEKDKKTKKAGWQPGWFEEAARLAETHSEELWKRLLTRSPKESNITATNVIDSFRRRADLRIQADQQYFQLILNQIALERVTAGAYCPELRPRPKKENGVNGKAKNNNS